MEEKSVFATTFSCCFEACQKPDVKVKYFDARTFTDRKAIEARLGFKVKEISDLAGFIVCRECGDKMLAKAAEQAKKTGKRFHPSEVLTYIDVVRKALEAEAAENRAFTKIGDLVGLHLDEDEDGSTLQVAPVAHLHPTAGRQAKSSPGGKKAAKKVAEG